MPPSAPSDVIVIVDPDSGTATNVYVWETEEALTLAMEVPGVAREAVTIELKEDVLRVEARVDASKYEGLEPLYT